MTYALRARPRRARRDRGGVRRRARAIARASGGGIGGVGGARVGE